jgi:hypothetical protein
MSYGVRDHGIVHVGHYVPHSTAPLDDVKPRKGRARARVRIVMDHGPLCTSNTAYDQYSKLRGSATGIVKGKETSL